ncbi:hypothetical protein G9C85_09455 [Halorubellus sp. JP-L1]|uniref:hypothetical protein n=1 Tax=Halorubellus sp. JP-L1 TaxID=2715753 RepID=UPI00140A9765|nr:hypothetical protein [Halorubellus sp. JP-L1]NHN41855.1 hypothetical protein [Halorubellus sp. JP-L1]
MMTWNSQIFQIRVKETNGGYQAQEVGSTNVGAGESIPDAITDYAERCKRSEG